MAEQIKSCELGAKKKRNLLENTEVTESNWVLQPHPVCFHLPNQEVEMREIKMTCKLFWNILLLSTKTNVTKLYLS